MKKLPRVWFRYQSHHCIISKYTKGKHLSQFQVLKSFALQFNIRFARQGYPNLFHFHIYKLRFYSNFTPHVTLPFGRTLPYAQNNDMPLQGRCIAGLFMWLLFRFIFSNSFPCTTQSSCCQNIKVIPTLTMVVGESHVQEIQVGMQIKLIQ